MHRPHCLAPTPQTARILFAYKTFAPVKGISHAGLGISQQNTANTLRGLGLWSKVQGITSSENLRAIVAEAQRQARSVGDVPLSHVIIAAPWLATSELCLLTRDFPEVTFAVVCHSNCGFLSCDRDAVRLLKEMVGLQLSQANFRLAGNSTRFAHWAEHAYGHAIARLPNLYDCSTFKRPSPHAKQGTVLRIGCFGAVRALKNMFTAAAAALEIGERLGRDVEFHMTVGRDDNNWILQPIVELLGDNHRATLVRHEWACWPEFRRLVSRMHILLQPSFTESFNLVTADGIAEGVASAVSKAINWVPAKWQVEADDAHELATTAIQLLSDPDAPHDGQTALKNYVASGSKDWMHFLVG